MNSIAEHRRFFAEFIVAASGAGGALARRLTEAFAGIPREDFLGPGPWPIFTGNGYLPTISADPRLLYQDVLVALAPERRINNGQPSLHARCLAAAAPQPGEAVVHVGAGTGYYTAVLATLVGAQRAEGAEGTGGAGDGNGTVLAIEREADLAARAETALASHAAATLAPFAEVQVRSASATDDALPPCDLIYVNAGATHPPAAWLDALRIGGRLVLPLTPDEGFGVMLLVTRLAAERWAASAFVRVAFIPCIGARDAAASASLTRALERHSLKDVRSLHRGTPPDASAWCTGDGWWLSSAEA